MCGMHATGNCPDPLGNHEDGNERRATMKRHLAERQDRDGEVEGQEANDKHRKKWTAKARFAPGVVKAISHLALRWNDRCCGLELIGIHHE